MNYHFANKENRSEEMIAMSDDLGWLNGHLLVFRNNLEAQSSMNVIRLHDTADALKDFMEQEVAKFHEAEIVLPKSFNLGQFCLEEDEDETDTEGKGGENGQVIPKNQENQDEDQENEERSKERHNLLVLWKKYIDEMDEKNLTERQKKLRDALSLAAEPVIHVVPIFAFAPPPANDVVRSKISDADAQREIEGRDKIKPVPAEPESQVVTEPYGPFLPGSPAKTYPSIVFTPMKLDAGAIGFVGGMAGSYVISSLIKSTSYIAIASAVGFFGITGFPALAIGAAGVVLTGAACGALSAGLVSTIRNIKPIHESLLQAREQGTSQWKAFGDAIVKSADKDVLLRGAIMGAFGGAAGTLLQHAGDIASFFGMGNAAPVANVPPMTELTRMQATMGDLPAAADITPDLNMSGNPVNINGIPVTDSPNEAFLHGQADAAYAIANPVDVSTVTVDANHAYTATDVGIVSDPCPEYITECLVDTETVPVADVKPPVAGISFNLMSEAQAAELPVQDNTHTILATQNDSYVVVKGDELENIVKEQYNIADATVDLDKDGIADLDEAVAAVSKANGLVGNQQNWLKIGWELKLGDVDLNELSDKIDRPSLDANWREGDVTYSDVPKFAL